VSILANTHYCFVESCDICGLRSSKSIFNALETFSFHFKIQVKASNKLKLAQYLQESTGVIINPASMFDIQVKLTLQGGRNNIQHKSPLHNDI
jgi:hypothetical protein